ncbi:MAG: tetratricopeptide repeat protein [Candidatus Firestonebacteria bacterium]|nr:tetratricopeptide repeat protein [Candidatus Firestonebacteria bacterium]
MSIIKCVKCGFRKGPQPCKIKSGNRVCSVCCLILCNGNCKGCSYYKPSKKISEDKKFIAILNPEIEEKCKNIMSLAEKGQIKKANKLMSELLIKYPNSHTIQFYMGTLYALDEEFERAIEFFKRAIQIFPYFIEAYFNLALAYTKIFNLSESVSALKNVIRLSDSSNELAIEAKKRLNDLENLVKHEKGLSLSMYLENEKIFKKAFEALRKEDYYLAIELFESVLKVDPENVQSWGNLGLAYAGLGKKSKALECLSKAIELDPDYEVAIINRIFLDKEMEEGKSLSMKDIKSVEYYKDYKDRSLIDETINNIKNS